MSTLTVAILAVGIVVNAVHIGYIASRVSRLERKASS